MATLAAQAVPQNSGLTPTYNAAAAGGDRVPAGNGVLVVVKNASTAAVTVTLVTPGTVEGDLAIADRSYSVPASTGEVWFPVGSNYRAADGLATINYSAVTSVTVACVRVA